MIRAEQTALLELIGTLVERVEPKAA